LGTGLGSTQKLLAVGALVGATLGCCDAVVVGVSVAGGIEGATLGAVEETIVGAVEETTVGAVEALKEDDEDTDGASSSTLMVSLVRLDSVLLLLRCSALSLLPLNSRTVAVVAVMDRINASTRLVHSTRRFREEAKNDDVSAGGAPFGDAAPSDEGETTPDSPSDSVVSTCDGAGLMAAATSLSVIVCFSM